MSDLERHLLDVVHCPVAKAAWAGAENPCSSVVGYQAGRETFQVPTPWVGRLDQAAILFIGANPSTGFVEDYPDWTWPDHRVVDSFQEAFTSSYGWIQDGIRQRHVGGHYSRGVRFWSQVKSWARELVEREPEPGVDYAITEIVRCRSQSEWGVAEAVGTCSDRFLTQTLALSPARVLAVLGQNAGGAFRSVYGLENTDLVPATIGGHPRIVLFLPHPNAREDKKLHKRLAPDDLDRLRAVLRQ